MFHNGERSLMRLHVFLRVPVLPAGSPLLPPGEKGLKEPAGTEKVNVTASRLPYFEVKHGFNRFQCGIVIQFLQFIKPRLNEK